MSFSARIAAAAIAIAIVIGSGVLILRPGSTSNVGNIPSAAPTASSAPSPTPATSNPAKASPSSLALGAAPDRTLGDWQAMSDVALPGLFAANEHLQLSIDWQDGKSIWIQTSIGQLILKSDVLASPASEIDVVTSAGTDALGCTGDQVGKYSWSRSADGLFLTLTPISDACQNRQTALSRPWVHSLSAVTDGGLGVFPFDPWIRMTIPVSHYGLSGSGGVGILQSGEGPERTLVVIGNPLGIDSPCGATRKAVDIPATTAGFVAYVRSLPGFTVATATATVGGRPAVHLTMTPKGSATCLAGEIVAFHGADRTASDAERSLTVSQPHSLWIVDTGAGTALVVYEGAGVTAAEEQSVISSFQFLPNLPTP